MKAEVKRGKETEEVNGNNQGIGHVKGQNRVNGYRPVVRTVPLRMLGGPYEKLPLKQKIGISYGNVP